MRALIGALPLAFLSLAGTPLAQAAPGTAMSRLAAPRVTLPSLGEGEILLQVDPDGKITKQGDQIVATGGVTVTQGDARLSAQKVTYNPDLGVVVAEGDVVFTQPGRTVRGQRVTYDTNTQQARAESAETVVNGVIVRAQGIRADQSRYTVTGASITTCDRPRPHYRLTARTVTVIPDDRMVARHVGVWLFGTRLFVLPSLTARIGQGRGEGGESLFPRVGRNSRDGFYLAKVMPVLESSRLYLDIDGRLTTRRGLLGGFDAAAPAGPSLQIIGALKYRDEAPNQRTTFLEVDRLPEMGVLFVSPPPIPRSRPRRREQPAAAAPPAGGTPAAESPEPAAAPFRPYLQVGSDVEHQPGLLRPAAPGRWYVRAQATVGYFHQREASVIGGEAESTSHGRLDMRGTAMRSGLRLLGVTLPVVEFFVRKSFYDDGLSYNVFGAAARQDWRAGAHWTTSLRAFLHQTSGQTPFEWDRVEIRTELQPALSYTAGGTTLGWVGRMDLDRSQLFDQVFSIARVFDCLEPRISYDTRRRQVSLEVRIVGLQTE